MEQQRSPNKNLSWRTRRYIPRGPSPRSSDTRFLFASQLILVSVEVTSMQSYVLVHKQNNFLHLNSFLKRPCSALSCLLFCFAEEVSGQHGIDHSKCSTEILPTIFFPNAEKLTSSLVDNSRLQRILVHFQFFHFVNVTNFGGVFVVESKLRSFARWKMTIPTMTGSRSWICVSAISITCKPMFNWLRFFNSLLLARSGVP